MGGRGLSHSLLTRMLWAYGKVAHHSRGRGEQKQLRKAKEKGPEFPNILQGCLAVRDSQYPNYQSIPSSSCSAQALVPRCSSRTGHCLACLPVVCAHLCNCRSHVILERLPGQPAPGLLLRACANQMCFVFSMFPYGLIHNLLGLAYYFQASISTQTSRRDAG